MKAFPKTGSIEFCDPQTGMDLRDYFAAKALQGIMASGQLKVEVPREKVAEVCFDMADAMMKARGQG